MTRSAGFTAYWADPARRPASETPDPSDDGNSDTDLSRFRAWWAEDRGRDERAFDEAGPELFTLRGPVGPDEANDPADVARIETLLERLGYHDLADSEGPTGEYGPSLESAIRRYQKDRYLARDGAIDPGGPTLREMAAETATGDRFRPASRAAREWLHRLADSAPDDEASTVSGHETPQVLSDAAPDAPKPGQRLAMGPAVLPILGALGLLGLGGVGALMSRPPARRKSKDNQSAQSAGSAGPGPQPPKPSGPKPSDLLELEGGRRPQEQRLKERAEAGPMPSVEEERSLGALQKSARPYGTEVPKAPELPWKERFDLVDELVGRPDGVDPKYKDILKVDLRGTPQTVANHRWLVEECNRVFKTYPEIAGRIRHTHGSHKDGKNEVGAYARELTVETTDGKTRRVDVAWEYTHNGLIYKIVLNTATTNADGETLIPREQRAFESLQSAVGNFVVDVLPKQQKSESDEEFKLRGTEKCHEMARELRDRLRDLAVDLARLKKKN